MLKDKLTIGQVMEMKRMGKTAALIYARTRYPELDKDELRELEGICGLSTPQSSITTPQYDPHKHAFISAMWLLGASQKQLGRKFGVAQQTISSHLDRGLRNYPDRGLVRLAAAPMAPERLESLYDTFYKMNAIESGWYKELTPLELAAAMSNIPTDEAHSHTEDEDMESLGDYAELSTPASGTSTETQRVGLRAETITGHDTTRVDELVSTNQPVDTRPNQPSTTDA